MQTKELNVHVKKSKVINEVNGNILWSVLLHDHFDKHHTRISYSHTAYNKRRQAMTITSVCKSKRPSTQVEHSKSRFPTAIDPPP